MTGTMTVKRMTKIMTMILRTDDNDDGDKKEDDCDVRRWRRALPKERSMSIPGEFLRLVTILLLVRLPNL